MIPHTLTWKHPLEEKKEGRKESIEDLALLFTPSKTEIRRRGTVPYRIRVAREEYKKLKPILEAKKKNEERRTKNEEEEARGENEGG